MARESRASLRLHPSRLRGAGCAFAIAASWQQSHRRASSEVRCDTRCVAASAAASSLRRHTEDADLAAPVRLRSFSGSSTAARCVGACMSSDVWGPVCSRSSASAGTRPPSGGCWPSGRCGRCAMECFGTRSALVTWRFAACCGLELHPVGVFSNATFTSLRRPRALAFGFGRAHRSRPVRGGCMHAHVAGFGRRRARVSARGARASVRVAMQRWFHEIWPRSVLCGDASASVLLAECLDILRAERSPRRPHVPRHRHGAPRVCR